MSKKTSWEKEFDNKLTSKSLDADGIWHGEEIKQFIKKVETDAVRGVISSLKRCKTEKYGWSLNKLENLLNRFKSNLKEEKVG